jgi:hypothetical protein
LKWILFRLTSLNSVLFNNSESEDLKSLPYKKFLDYLYDVTKYHLVENNKDMIKELNSYEVIYLNLEDGKWEIIEDKGHDNIDFMSLANFNKELEQRKVEQTQQIRKIDRDNLINLRGIKNNMLTKFKNLK